MKKIILSVSALLTLAIAKADDVPTHMVIHFNDGSNVSFALENKPSVVFGDNMSVALDPGTGEAAASRQFSELKSIELSRPGSASVDQIESAQCDIAVMPDRIFLSGFNTGEEASVYNLHGQRMLNQTITGGSTVVDCSGLSSGVYLLRAGNKSIKFIKH